jgi:hypothetical protein
MPVADLCKEEQLKIQEMQIWMALEHNIMCLERFYLLHGLSPRANYTDRATAACRRSDCQLLRIEGDTLSAWRIPTAVFSIF